MTKLALPILACLAIGLGGVIAVECSSYKHKGAVPMPADNLRLELAAPHGGGVRQVQTWVDVILARPLFEPSRRPPPAAAGSGATVPGFPRLTGIIIMPQQSEAIFAVPGRTQPIVVTAGSRLNGVLIKSITAGSVIVADAAGVRILRPSFAAAGSAAAGAPPPSAMIDLPPSPSGPHVSPFASIRGLSGRPLGLVAHPDTPPSGGAGFSIAPTPPSLASPGVSP